MKAFYVKIISSFIAGILIFTEIGMPVFAMNPEKSEDAYVDFGRIEETAAGYRISPDDEQIYEISSEEDSFSEEEEDEVTGEDYSADEAEETGTDELEPAEASSEPAELTADELELAALVETGECGEDLKYSISGDIFDGYTLTITGSGAMYDYNNSELASYSPWRKSKYKISKIEMSDEITKIGDYAFHTMNSLTGELKLPQNLKSIGRNAFYGCNNLTGNINIPDNTTVLGDNVFYGCTGFNGVLNLPESMERIGNSAFESCENLTGDIIIPFGIVSISGRTFAGCSGFNGNLKLPEDLEAIQNEAFLNCSGLTGNVTLPSTFKYLGASALNGCSGFNGTLFIPEGIETISTTPIYKCTGFEKIINKSNKSVTLPVLTDNFWYLEGDEAKNHIEYIELGTAIRNSAVDNPVKKEGQCGPNLYYSISGNDIDGYELSFSGSGSMNSYTNSAYPWAVSSEPYKTKIKTISFCDGMTNIPGSAFREMSGLTGTIDLPDTVETVGALAFAYCNNIKEIILGKNLVNLQSEAFYNAGSLTKISIRDNAKYLFRNGILYEKNADNELILKICLYTRGRLVGESVINITNDTTLSEIVGFAQYGIIDCPYITEVDLTGAEKMDSITVSNIVGCENLSSIILPQNINRINEESLVDLNNCEITVYCKYMELNQWGIYGSNCSYVTYSSAPSRTVAKKSGLNVDKTLDPKYTVAYYLPDGMTLLYREIVTEGENAEGPSVELIPEIEGKIFVGWNKSLENITADTMCIAVYAKNKCKVIFDTQAAVYQPVYVKGGETIVLPRPTAKGLTFKGWYPTEDGSGEPYTDETVIMDDVTLYAYWYYADVAVKGVNTSYEYTGQAIKPVVEVYDGSELLKEKIDYVVSYKNNVNIYELGKDDSGFDAAKAPTVIITGKGNYNGVKKVYFKIEKHSMLSGDIEVKSLPAVVETGKEIKPLPVVMQGSKKLVINKDYTLGYYSDLNCLKPVSPVSPGKYYVKVAGQGGYYKYTVASFEIVEGNKKLLNKFTIKKIPDKQYTGSPVMLNAKDIVIMDGKKQLAPGFDYTLAYTSDNTNIGVVNITITGTGATYVGTKEASFKIVGTDLKKATVKGLITTMTFNGRPRVQTTLELTHNDNRLKGISKEEYEKLTPAQQKDYSYITEYSNNTNVGSATLLLTGVNGYSGTVKKAFKIVKYNIANDVADLFKINLEKNEYEYVKGGVTPDVVVTYCGVELTKGKDYTVAYTNNKLTTAVSGKKGTVIVTGIGNYTGKDTSITFTVVKRDMESGGIKITATDKIATGKKNTWKSAVVVTDINGQRLIAGKDYETNVVYSYEDKKPVLASDIVPAGTTIIVEIRGKGDYMGSARGKYRIYGKDISKYATFVADKIYSGKPATIGYGEVVFKQAGKEINDVTYEIDALTYKNNSKKGVASVVIRGTGEYGGSKAVTFKITSMSME